MKRQRHEVLADLRKSWREQVQVYHQMCTTVWRIILCPEATAEDVMFAKEATARVHKEIVQTQQQLEQHKLLGFKDPRV